MSRISSGEHRKDRKARGSIKNNIPVFRRKRNILSPVNNEDSQNKNSLVVTGYAQSFMESDSRERDARRTGYRYVFSKGLFMSYIV